jgi:hypothetical protein
LGGFDFSRRDGGYNGKSGDGSTEYDVLRSSLGSGYAAITEHVVKLDYWVSEWRLSPPRLMTREEYKKSFYPDFPSWMKVSTKDLFKRDKEVENGFMLQLFERAMLREFESVVEKLKAVVLPALDYTLPRDSRKIQEMAKAHAQEEKEVLKKTRQFFSSFNMVKAFVELGEVRKSVSKLSKVRPKSEETETVAKALHQVLDAFLESWRKRADRSGRLFG